MADLAEDRALSDPAGADEKRAGPASRHGIEQSVQQFTAAEEVIAVDRRSGCESGTHKPQVYHKAPLARLCRQLCGRGDGLGRFSKRAYQVDRKQR